MELQQDVRIHGRYLAEGQVLASYGPVLYVLDVASRSLKPLLQAQNPKANITSAALSHKKEYTAYSTWQHTTDPEDESTVKGEVWIFDLRTSEAKKLFELNPVALYGALQVLGWGTQDRTLLTRDFGADAGDFWGDLYVIDVENPANSTKIRDQVGDARFLLGSLSPYGGRWLYTHCTDRPKAEERNLTGPGAQHVRQPLEDICPSGEELLIGDLESSRQDTVCLFRGCQFSSSRCLSNCRV